MFKRVVGIGVVLLLLIVAGCGEAPQSSAPSQTTATTAPTTVPTQVAMTSATPTVAPTPTVALSQGEPVLGASLGTFVAKFGQPNSCSNPPLYNLKPACQGPAGGVSVLTLDDGHGHNLVQSITDDAPDIGWDVGTARAVCLAFLPPDAQYKGRTDEATTNATGFILRYYSATVGQEFTPDQFRDGQGNPTPSGVFEVAFVDGNGGPTPTSQIAWCDVTIGKQGATDF
ncbi:MAG TPA: hypothetical protein VF043_12985 [Ktedonobacteraceae bacterium]